MAGRPPSPQLIQALQAVAAGSPPFRAAVLAGLGPDRVYVALSRFKDLEHVPDRARAALTRFGFTGQPV